MSRKSCGASQVSPFDRHRAKVWRSHLIGNYQPPVGHLEPQLFAMCGEHPIEQIHRRRSQKASDKPVDRPLIDLFGSADLLNLSRTEYDQTVGQRDASS